MPEAARTVPMPTSVDRGQHTPDLPAVVLITGAASGMGAAHARHLAATGCHICAADVTDCDPVVADITTAGGSATAHRLDVTDPAQWSAVLAEVTEDVGPLGGLVNNAGVSHRRGIDQTSDSDWHRVLEVNLSGPFYGMRAAAPHIRDSGGGAIVNISSTSGQLGYHAAAYTASKWGLRGLTKTAAAEYAPWKIRVNSIHPGLIQTPMVEGADAFVASSLRSIPASRAGEPTEVSAAVSFLLSAQASYLTGIELTVDGGLTAAGTYWRINHEAAAQSKGGDL